jgi:hypothetical protein
MLVSGQAGAADSTVVTEDSGFQKGEAFSVRKAMKVIFGNVDEQNRSTLKSDENSLQYRRFGCNDVQSLTVTAVEWKAFMLNNVETVFLATSAAPQIVDGKSLCPAATPYIGMYIFEKMDDRWELSASRNHLTEAGYDGDATFDFVKIGKDQVALAINDGGTDEGQSGRWTDLYSLVGGEIELIFKQNVYHDNQGACFKKRGPGRVYVDPEDLDDNRLLKTCHRFKSELYILPSDLKINTLKSITTDIIEWKGPDGKRLTPKRLELDYVFSEERYNKYHRQLPTPATGPMVPLFDDDSNYKKRRQSLEKSAKDVR